MSNKSLGDLPIRNPVYNAEGNIDCEVQHPDLGWIPFTASLDDHLPHTSVIFNRAKKMKPKKYTAPTVPLKDVKARATDDVHRFATMLRQQLAGTDDPVKIGEHINKGNNAQSVIDGTANEGIVAEAEKEAASLGLSDAVAVAKIWLEKAADQREARSTLNTNVRDTIAAIDAAKSVKAVAAIRDDLMQALNKGLDDGSTD